MDGQILNVDHNCTTLYPYPLITRTTHALTWMNWMVRALLPTPPPPTTTNLNLSSSLDIAAMDPAVVCVV